MFVDDQTARPVLATTVHDGDGHLLGGLRRLAEPMRQVFSGFGVLATTQTAAAVVTFLEEELGAVVNRAPAGDDQIGIHRRESVRLATTLTPSVVLYSDIDHVLRWIEADRAELEQQLAEFPADFVVIGRTDRAMKACPRRLRDTEAIVNHIYALATGRSWDLMFATRVMSPRAAAAVVEHCRENTIANDVEWPIVIEHKGFEIAYREADGLSYRITTDFDFVADTHDHDPIMWAKRVEIANQHAQTLKRLLATRANGSAYGPNG